MEAKDVVALVKETFASARDEGRVVLKSWLVQEVLSKRAPSAGDDAEFYEIAAHMTISDLVGREIRAHKANENDPNQVTLPGYEFIQLGYSIERDGRPCYVPIVEMTTVEIRSKASELLALARGANAHAMELLRFADERELAAE